MGTRSVIPGLALLVCLALITACATTKAPIMDPSAGALSIDFPNPLSGPGGSQLSRKDKKHLTNGWRSLRAGDTQTARREAGLSGNGPESALLDLQAQLVSSPGLNVERDLTHLTEEWPRYAAAFLTLSAAGERMGNERLALSAARDAADLWPSGPFAERSHQLESRWIHERIERGETEIDSKNFETAISFTASALALDPENPRGLLTQARAQVGLDLFPEAEATLVRLGDDPEALLLRAEISSNGNHWQQAMNLLSRLPEEDDRKRNSLRKARLRWRLSILPAYVREAVDSKDLTREQLAVILISLTPELETFSGGQTPLMPDILNLESQRAILTVTRLSIMSPDPVEHRFLPHMRASLETIRNSIDAVSHLTGYRVPLWCRSNEMVQSECISVDDPVTGQWLTEVLLALVEEDTGV
ncbi:MAG: tetratricopeptide repeat protein [Thermoanaerobaculales bacterium]|nr:tetratricopeptide repeat protein [Thermoanaerobaculales bacterium]